MKKAARRRYLVWGAVGLAVLVLIGLAFMPEPVAVDLATVDRGPLEVTLGHEGKTRVRERFAISASVAGRVLRIELEPGDPVRAGETVLATFRPSEPVPLDARSRAEAEARLEAARAALDRARAERDQAASEHALAVTERERLRRLAAAGVASQDALDSAETRAASRGEALAAAEAAVRRAVHDLAVARAGLLEPAAGDAGGRTVLELRSPVDGVVLRRARESEAVVPAGEPLLEVGDPDDLEVVADFLSTDAVRIRPGMAARIERWGGDEPLAATVRRVEPSGFLKISALGVEEQRVNVILDFEEPAAAAGLGDEYRVEVAVITERRDDALRVPVSALFRDGDGGGWAAFAVVDGEARTTPVEIGVRNDLRAEVLGGLEAGDRVIVHPADEIEEGVGVEERG